MTKITRLVLNGFKSFGKWTEVPFGDGFNVILGPNGSGKCLVGSSLVSLADGSIVKIEKIVEEGFAKNKPNVIDDGFIGVGDGRKVLCMDMNSLKVVEKSISHYVKRSSPEKLLAITTRSGRKVTVTPYHPLFVLSDGTVREAKAEELKEGTRIAVPRKIELKTSSKTFYELLDLINPEDGLYVPFNQKFVDALKKAKGRLTSEEFSKKVNVPKLALKGLLDQQSINFSFLVRLLRHAGFSPDEIIELIPFVRGKTTSSLCRFPWKNSQEFARLLGYLLAEGRIASSSSQVWFTNSDSELVDDYSSLAREVFGLEPSVNEYKAGCYDVLLYSQPAIVILEKFGMSYSGSGGKNIPNVFLAHSGSEELSELLSGLFSGDGYVSKSHISITTKSKEMGFGIEHILTRLGITYISKWIVKRATNSGFSGIYRDISISGVENVSLFTEKIKMKHNMKSQRALELLMKKPNTNVDLMEVNSLVKKTVSELGISVKKHKKDLAILDAYAYNTCLPSLRGVQHLVRFFETSSNANQSQSLVELKKLSSSHIYWDEITSIEEMASKEKWVYDLCVEKDHNFIADNVFVHNSNILDALCFVLGRISSKSMRAEKLGYLVYNGGKTKKPAARGEVTIFFDNASKQFAIDTPLIKVSRLVKPDGQSIYKINDERRTRQQVIELLSAAQIDPDGHNIVLQGDIIHFVEMSPEERRQVIEETAGISVYEDKKKKALSELEKVDQSLREADILLSEKKTHLKELKQDRDQAIRFREIGDKLKANKATLINLQISKKEAEKQNIEKVIGENNSEIANLQAEIATLKKTVDEKKDQVQKTNHEIEEKGEKEQLSLNKEIEELKVGIGTANNRGSMVDGQLQKIIERRESLKQELSDKEQRISEITKQKTDLEKRRIQLLLDKTRIEASIDKIRKDTKVADIGDIESEIEKIEKDLEARQSENQIIVEKRQTLLREKDRLEVMISGLESQFNKVAELEKESKKELAAIKSKRDDFKKIILELNTALNEDSMFAQRLADAKRKLANAEDDFAKARAKTAVTRDVNYTVQKIMEQKEKIKGIFGTVADLGKVSAKYGLALEVAAGPRINSIVVQNEDVAAECIKFLKQNKLGVASFLPLTKLKQDEKEASKFSKANGVQGNAIDLVSFDPKFRKVFSYVFGNTLVVDSIDVAKRIGIGEARMVSLDGDLAELSGAMHGGFRQARQRAFAEADAEKEQLEAGSKVSEMETLVSLLTRQRTDNENKIMSLKNKKAELEGDIIKAEHSLSLDSADLETSTKQKELFVEQLHKIEEQISLEQDHLSEKSRLIATIKGKKQSLRDKISELRNPAVVAELTAFEQKRQSLVEEILSVDNQVKQSELQLNEVFLSEREKISQILKQLEKEEHSFHDEKNQIKEKLESSKKLLKEAEEKAATFQKKYRELFELKSKLAGEIQKTEEKIIRKEEEINRIEMKINNTSLKSTEIASDLGALKKEFESYTDIKLLEETSEEKLKEHIYRYDRNLIEMGNVNLKALEVYDDVEKQYNSLLEKKERLTSEKNDVIGLMDEIEIRKKELFLNTFNTVNENFIRIFQQLSTKGEARLVIEDEAKIFDSGVRIRVNLTGEKFLDIRGLSGGEKTMTALALIFAIQEQNPASFYILDEVDAALDKKNSEKLSQLIRKYSEKAQYIVISHNDNVLTAASNLYGISMDEHGISNVVSLKV